MSGRKVTISYNEFQPLTGWPGKGFVRDSEYAPAPAEAEAEDGDDGDVGDTGMGGRKRVESRVSSRRRRMNSGERTLSRISTLA